MKIRPFRASRVPVPRDDTLFPATAKPVDLEIGCGVGYHPIQYAQANPDRLLVAIEHTKTRYARFARRLEGHPHLGNIIPIHANAISWITHRVKPGSVERLFLLYPNPYPKASQSNRRWHAMPFMGQLLEILVSRGTLHLATNEAFYAEDACSVLRETWGMNCLHQRHLHHGDIQPRSHFEKKYLLREGGCYDLVFQKP
jgi:tRNA (guanine-N7-)-methyltransferase